MNAMERFDSKLARCPMSGCWLWIGYACPSTGYGEFVLNGRHIKAHVASWELHRGPVPAGLSVLHRCDVRPCVNPYHLFVGTHADNMADMVTKGRHLAGRITAPRRGELHKLSKLTAPAVIAILADVRSSAVIAKEYEVSKTLVKNIKARKTWKHLL